MKKVLLAVAAVGLIGLSGCNKEKDWVCECEGDFLGADFETTYEYKDETEDEAEDRCDDRDVQAKNLDDDAQCTLKED